MTELIIYQEHPGDLEICLEGETLWLSLNQIANLFGVNKSAISKHLKRIYDSEELAKEATVSKKETVQQEGARNVRRTIDYYNLDVILSVGYRINSGQATQFRIWATKILREHLTRDWAKNRQRLATMVHKLETALQPEQQTDPEPGLSQDEKKGVMRVISRYTRTFHLLQQYDEGVLTDPKGEQGGVLPAINEARNSIATLKTYLIQQKEASDLFGREQEEGLAAILGNLEQTVLGEPAYPTLEAKAAHLLYFVIKNHPFSDGNKRTGAFLFVNFLQRNQRLYHSNGQPILNDIGLAALTLLIAESDPKAKETIIRLVVNMLAG